MIELTIIEITLVVMIGIFIPIFRYFYNADKRNNQILADLCNRVKNLEIDANEAKQEHKEIRDNINQMKNDITEIKTLLSIKHKEK